MKGTVTFKDGHVEDITFGKFLEENDKLIFETESNNKYYYKAGMHFNPDLMVYIPWSGFYKYDVKSGEWLITIDIEKVNISEL